ncbi:MAG: alkyl hydroperoxide reductase/Thiol specific antioxidant/Mal allergen [Acidimicrobiaceae bacterium]|nr:alkyl hydroperoxide reductase/Thiol specific antioxidant/Mal allergen [Acidimicrobiaceae bacterium]
MGEAQAPLSGAERSAAFAAGPPKVSRRTLVIGGAVLLALALGGTLGERLFSAVGLNPRGAGPTHGTTATRVASGGVPPSAFRALPKITAPPGGKALAAYMGTQALAPSKAPRFALVDQAGQRVWLAGERGRVVVLSFFDSACNDICPVLGHELARADSALGARAARVEFVTVNTDPLTTSLASDHKAVGRSGLSSLSNWEFLTGSLSQLDRVWKAYGISIEAASNGQVAHNDLLYFLAPDGTGRYRVTPFADETSQRAYVLPPATQARWAAGIAAYAASLTGSSK